MQPPQQRHAEREARQRQALRRNAAIDEELRHQRAAAPQRTGQQHAAPGQGGRHSCVHCLKLSMTPAALWLSRAGMTIRPSSGLVKEANDGDHLQV
jgi:hypothetical protein